MIKVALKYGVRFETSDPTSELIKLLPLWHHFGEDTTKIQYNNKPQSKCLREKHNVLTVGDATDLIARLHEDDHQADAECHCPPCIEDRVLRDCVDPHKCILAAVERLGLLQPIWNPLINQRETRPVLEEDGSDIFCPPRQITTLTEGLRIFTKVKDTEVIPQQPAIPRRDEAPGQQLTIFIEAKTIRNNEGSTEAGGGAWYGPENPRNFAIKLPKEANQSIACAEVVTALVALKRAPLETRIKILSSRSILKTTAITNLESWEDLE
ncbi:hypothetical protein B0H11DRAFT_1715750 [Mycena galericulata]|nr:hypothetical protein B0H11DRAFT_1715750 [Mycena galericulata]